MLSDGKYTVGGMLDSSVAGEEEVGSKCGAEEWWPVGFKTVYLYYATHT